MKEKQSIALVSVTLNAVNPMTDYLMKHAPEFQVNNYLDSCLQGKIKKEGRISDDSMQRMLNMLATACKDGADGIVITCTVFSPYQPLFAGLFSVPVICPDGAMLDTVSKLPGKTAIICIFDSTAEPTRKLYLSFCKKNGTPEKVDMYVLPEALALQQSGDMEACNQKIREKVMELDEAYDQIILAQISMAGAAEHLHTRHAEVFTSPASALTEVRKAIAGKT